MKSLRVFAVVGLLCLLVQACSDSGNEAPFQIASAPGDLGKVSLSFSNPPEEITDVVATLMRSGYPPHVLQLTISDSTHSASGSLTNIPPGIWHLRVEALDSIHVVRYSGETDVQVVAGQTANVTLQLVAGTGGGIHITVTWGGPPPTGADLMAYYPLDGNANDMSGNGNNGVISGAVPTADRNGHPNRALFFDGVNDKITIASSQSLHPVNQLTIAFWMRVDSMKNNYLAVIHKCGEAQQQPYLGNREYAVYLKNHVVPWYYFQTYSAGNGGSQHQVIQQPPLATRQWVFFAAVIDRQNHVMRCYVNGVLNGESPDSYSSFNVNNHPLTIGFDAETVWTDHGPFFGALDDIRFYRRALAPGEIQALCNGQ